MKALKKMRMETGLTQYELSELLGVKRSRIALAETGCRKLGTKALLGVSHLEKYSITAERFSDKSDPEKELVKRREYLLSVKQDYTYRIILAQKKLQNMEKVFIQAHTAILLYTYFKDNNLHEDHVMLENKINELKLKILETGTFQQDQMRTQILLLTAVEERICDCLDKLEGIQYPMIT